MSLITHTVHIYIYIYAHAFYVYMKNAAWEDDDFLFMIVFSCAEFEFPGGEVENSPIEIAEFE